MEILADIGMQNVYTPLTSTQHLVFCIFATVLYLTLFYRKGAWHYLLIMAAIDLTYLTQTPLCTTAHSINILGIAEVIILISAEVMNFRYSKRLKKENANDEDDRRIAAEKLQEEKDAEIIDNAFDE